ncbi:hypothetical protein P3T27_004918 [Kitasatospora sp. MAA19]|uniref:hypothetical protein n=1 Tax=Kitasatospora sp. MAA19 TaxID=3035090 RepID=UPI00247603A2|nr:hypothetical protein [Kitasatospora sp. MAA19]MDH6708179.1 hypothetical protein [Kitasatospora sp. MAA19]
MAKGRKKQKRPLSDAAAAQRPKTAQRKRPRKDKPLSPRTIRRTAALVAVLAPVTIVGLMVLAVDPDHTALFTILAVLALIASLGALMAVRARGWVLWPGVLLGVLLLAVPTATTRAEVLAHRGERTEAVITWAHGSKDKGGRTHWTCGIRRTDGKPLPHAEYQGSGCYGSSDIGTTTTVLVDPEGWAPPASGDLDFAFLSGGVYAVAGLSLLWALLAAAAARRTLRESPAASRA